MSYHITVSVYVEPTEDDPTLQALARYANKDGEVELLFKTLVYPVIQASFYDPPEGGPEILGVEVVLPGTTKTETIQGDAEGLIKRYQEEVELEAQDQVADQMYPDD